MRLSPDTPPLKKPIPRDAFKAEVAAWAQKIQVTPREVHVRPMVHKWGSASTTGRVSFSTDLLRQHPDFRNRVIVEELLHLKVPSHGKLFKSLLKAYLG
ncbi:MAG: M48 family metallopeptidase [Candidatus Hydrogenedentes bacterium]|nr:M48 family metallopeptidase [Candidatus Hydrogenedentota bacterium]